MPQAGVALGMATKAETLGPEGHIVASITLFAVLIYEIVGPFLTKVALTKAGDIKEEERKSARDEHLAMKKQKELQKHRDALTKGSKVVTAGGIYGIVKEVQETTFLIEVAKDVVIKVDKGSVFVAAEDAQQQAK